MALEEIRITTILPNHLAMILGEILPTLPNTTNLLRIVLDADGRDRQEEGVDSGAWNRLDAVMSEHAENIFKRRKNQRLTLRFRTDREGVTGKGGQWMREIVGLLALFSKVGHIEYSPRY